MVRFPTHSAESAEWMGHPAYAISSIGQETLDGGTESFIHRSRRPCYPMSENPDMGHPALSRRIKRSEFFAEEADDVVGLDFADHAALRVDDGEGVEIVFVEHLGEIVLMVVGGTR